MKSLALSTDSTVLVSISEGNDEECDLVKWDVNTAQPLRTMPIGKNVGVPVGGVYIRPRPSNLFSPGVGEQDIISVPPAKTGNFAGMFKQPVRTHLLPAAQSLDELEKLYPLHPGQTNNAQASDNTAENTADLKSENEELKSKLREMTAVYQKMKELNESMFQQMVSSSLSESSALGSIGK